MLSSISTPIVFGIALVIGLLIGLLVASLFNREPKSTTDNPLPDKYVKEGYTEAARILYTPANRNVVTFIDGDYYDDFATLTPDQKRRVVRLVEGWTEWTGLVPKPQGMSSTPAVPEKPAAVMPEFPAAQPLGASTLTNTAAVPGAAPKHETLEDLGIVVPTIVEPVPQVISIGGTRQAKEPEKPKTIVDQINDKLMEIVAGTPSANKGIKLEDDGHQGVIVWVGLTHYDGVDAVADPEVQALIKQAVSKWEEESTK